MIDYERIYKLVEEKDISMSSLCRKLGVSKGYFTIAKKNNQAIPPERLAVIADVLGTTVEYLRGETDVKEKPAASGELSDKDIQIIKLASRLSDRDFETALKYLEFLANDSNTQ